MSGGKKETKIDLVMWTLNSERTLERCLASIGKAIPKNKINQKIIVDGHSKDGTVEIAERFGWTVYDADKVGIPYQANQALTHITTEIFASFEHDIILNPNWLQKVLPYMLYDRVAVAQGIRVATLPVLKEINIYGAFKSRKDKKHLRVQISIDNTLYKTEIIRAVEGFPTNCPLSVDQFLRERIENSGYLWIIDPHIVSRHIRNSIKEEVEHLYQAARLSKKASPLKNAILFAYSPLSSLKISIKTKCPQAMLVYTRLRFAGLRGSLHPKSDAWRLLKNSTHHARA